MENNNLYNNNDNESICQNDNNNIPIFSRKNNNDLFTDLSINNNDQSKEELLSIRI